MRGWRKRVAEGKRLAGTPVGALILNWLERHYPGQCDIDDPSSVGELIGQILEASARTEL
jgi:hypothetical protein